MVHFFPFPPFFLLPRCFKIRIWKTRIVKASRSRSRKFSCKTSRAELKRTCRTLLTSQTRTELEFLPDTNEPNTNRKKCSNSSSNTSIFNRAEPSSNKPLFGSTRFIYSPRLILAFRWTILTRMLASFYFSSENIFYSLIYTNNGHLIFTTLFFKDKKNLSTGPLFVTAWKTR